MRKVSRFSFVSALLVFLALNIAFLSPAHSVEKPVGPIMCDDFGALRVEANAKNAATKQDLVKLHRTLEKYRDTFSISVAESVAPIIAYSASQNDYDSSTAARNRWRRIQRELNRIPTVKLTCDDSPGEEQEEEQEEGGVTGGNG